MALNLSPQPAYFIERWLRWLQLGGFTNLWRCPFRTCPARHRPRPRPRRISRPGHGCNRIRSLFRGSCFFSLSIIIIRESSTPQMEVVTQQGVTTWWTLSFCDMCCKSLCRIGLPGTYLNLLVPKDLAINPPHWGFKFKINNYNRRKSLLSKGLRRAGSGPPS